MPRVKGGPRGHKKHKNVLRQAKGYRGTRSRLFKRAQEAVLRAGKHAIAGRKQRKRDMRSLWITRINAALSSLGVSYGKFTNGLAKAKIGMNRKQLSELAIHDPKSFEHIVNKVRDLLN